MCPYFVIDDQFIYYLQPIYSESQENFLQFDNSFRVYKAFGDIVYVTDQPRGLFFVVPRNEDPCAVFDFSDRVSEGGAALNLYIRKARKMSYKLFFIFLHKAQIIINNTSKRYMFTT